MYKISERLRKLIEEKQLHGDVRQVNKDDTGQEGKGEASSSDGYQMSDRLKQLIEKGKETKKEQTPTVGYQMSDRLKGLTGNIDQDYVDRYLTDTNAFLSRSVDNINSMGYSEAMSGKLRESYQKERDDLLARGKYIRTYLQNNQGKLDKATVGQLMDYLDKVDDSYRSVNEAYSGRRSFYSQWETEDDYNSAVEAQKEYERLINFDTEAAAKELDELAAVEKQMHSLSNQISQAKSMPSYSPGSTMVAGNLSYYESELAKLEKQYGSYGDLKTQISQKNAYLTQAERAQNAQKLAGVTENSDFGQMSRYKGAKNGSDYEILDHRATVLQAEYNRTGDQEIWEELMAVQEQMAGKDGSDHSAADAIYTILNSSEEEWGGILNNESPRSMAHSYFKNLEFITDEEISVFNYWYNKSGGDKAMEYLDSLQETLNYRAAEKRFEAYEDKWALEMLFGIEAGLDQFGSGIKNLFTGGDDYIAPSSTQILSGMVRKDLGDNGPKLPEWLGGSSLGQVGYDFVTTSANMAPSILTSAALSMVNPTLGAVAGNTLMGASAAGNAYAEKINLGYSEDEARTYGLLVGSSEATLQYLLGGIGKLGGNGLSKVAINNLDKVDNILARVAKSAGGKIFLNGVSEGFEEGLQAILEPYLWQAVSGEEGSVSWEETLYNSLLGFVTGGVFESPGAIVQSAGQNIGYYKTGADIRSAGGTDALMALANEVAGVAPANMQNAIQKQSSKVDKKATSRRVGKLYDTVQNATSQADISQSLQTKGFSKETANDIAAAVIASKNGQDLSSAQRKLLKLVEKNSVAREAIASAMSSPQSSVGQRLREFQSGVARGNVTEAASAQLGKAGNITEGNLTIGAETAAEGRYGAGSDTMRIDTGEKVKIAGVATKDGKAISYRLDNGDTATGHDLALSESDAILASTLGEMNIGAEDANAIWQASDGSSAFAAGVRLSYEYGYQGQEYGKIDAKAFGEGFPEDVKKLAYNLGRKAIALENAGSYNKNITTKEGARDGAGESVHLRQGAQRPDGADTGRQVRGVEEAPGRVQKRKAAGKSESNGRSAAEAEGRVNAKDLGVPGGIGARKLTRVDGSYSADTKQAIAEATQNGLNVVCFTGGNLEIEGLGQARAAICGNDVFIRADHPEFTAMQLLRHEMAHREFGHAGEDLSGKVDVRKVYDRLVALCGTEEAVKNVIAMYSEAFDMGYDAETGADALAMEVFTEIVCDSQADMNAFAPEDQADMAGFMREIKRIAQEEKAQIQGRAPPDYGATKYSKESRKVTTFLRHYTGEVIEGEYIYLSNIEKATIKSNIKTGFAHIAPDAKRGIVSAHALNKEYTYHFVCNADYSVTVIDVLDNVADRTLLDRLLKEVIGDDRTGVRQTGKPINKEGHGQSNRRNDGITYEKAQQRKSTTELDGGTPESDWKRDSGSGRENRSNGGADTARNTEKVKFSRESVVEQVGSLVALHNLTESKLNKVLDLGGFPMPSIAVTRTDIPHTNFGDITLVMDKSAIDPQLNRKNTVYSADAWTPTVPRLAYKPSESKLQEIKKKVNGLVGSREVIAALDHVAFDEDNISRDLERYDGDLVDSYRRNNTLQYAFLKDIGEEIELPMKYESWDSFGKISNAAVRRFAGRMIYGLRSVDYYQNMGAQQLMEEEILKDAIAEILSDEVLDNLDPNSDKYKKLSKNPLYTADNIDFSHIHGMLSAARRYFTYGYRQTIDRWKAGQVVRNYIDENGLQERYEQWLRELFDGVVEKTGIYNNKDYFTPSGNRRSWEQLHLPATLDNIVKAMATQNGGNTKNVAGFNGVKTLRAGMAKRFKSIADMHKLEGRLQNLTEEEFEEIHDQLSDRMYDIISRIIDTGPKSSENRFIRMDSVGATLMEIAESGKYSVDAIQSAVNRYSYHIGESLAEDIRTLLYDVSQMPTNMFEAKPERSVGFDEVRAAVLPDNSSQKLRDSLAAKGIEVLVYEAGNDADRLVKLNSLLEKKTELRFSREFVSKQMSEQEKLLEKANKALEKSNAQLQEDNQYLKQMLKLQRQVTGGTKFTKSSVEAAARQLMKTSDAKGSAKELAELLNEFYEYVATGRELTWEDVMAKAQPAVDWLNKNRNRSFVREAYAQEILDEMRGRSFYLDESQRAEAAHAYGSYQAFRQKMWGTVTVSDKASMSLDEFWKEISEKHPFYFPEGTTSGDQVRGIVDALERLKTAEETNSELLDGYSEEMHERELLHEVYDSFWRVSTLRTVADVKQRQINALKSKHYAAMDKIRSEHKKAMTDLATDYGKRMKELRKAYRERTEDKAAKVKGRNAVEKQAKLLMNMLAHPTKDAHVPSDLQKPLEDFLHSIDFSSKQLNRGGEATIRDIAYTRALAAVRTAIAGQRNAIEGVTDGVFKLDIPDSFLEEIDKHNQAIIDATNGLDLTTNRVYDMSSDELADLGHILTVINKAIRDIDKLHMEGAKARVSDLALDTQKELRQRTPVKGEKGNAAMWASYTPWHAFRRMGSAAQQIFHGLMQGQAKLARTADSVIKFSQKTFTEKEVKSWEKEVHTINLQSGESVKMSTAQIMGFYCLSKREQGDSHMMGGGIRIGAIKPGKSKDIVQKDHYVLSIQDIAAINSKLTGRQRQVAEALQKYMETTGGRLINEISMARWGYAAASEIGYYPIKTDDATRDAKDPGQDKTNLWALLNKSFTKSLAPGAKNAMLVDSIFDVFSDHMSQVAEYNAFALPLVDAMKWFNYRERIDMDDGHIKDVGVQRAIRDTLGTSAVKYFTDLMTDINSSQKAGRHENFAGKLLSRAKVSSVGFNLRVAIQQPTAILRASLILDAPELVKGAVRIGTRKLVKEMQQYSGIALWKSMGYYDLNISRGLQEQIKGDDSFLDKANEVGMWLPGKMDEWTWARIWAACKAKASKDTKLTGEALSVETAKLFEDVVYQTQVADSVLTRSSLMRSKSQFMKEATSFMAEPTVSLNILLSAFQDYQKGHTTWDKAKRGLMIGFCGYALPAITNAIFTAFADAWRDDDEYEDFLDKFNQALFGEKKFLDGNLFSELNPLEKIPFIRDAISMLKGYSVAPGYADMIQSGIDLVDAYKKFLSGKGSKTEYGILYQTLQVLGSAVGIGAAPALREVVGIWNHTVGAMYPEYKLKRWETNPKTEIRDAYNRGYFTNEEAIAELLIAGIASGEYEAFWLVREWDYAKENGSAEGYSKYGEYYAAVAGNDRATANMLYDRLIAEKVAEGYLRSEAKDSIASSFTTQVKNEYMDGEISRSKAIDLLTANTDNGEAEVKKWDFELKHGFSWSARVKGYRLGKISESELISAVMDIEGESREEAEEYIRFLDLEMANQDISITASEASSYFEHAEPAGIAIDVYLDYKNKAKDITGEGKKKRRMDVIHSLPLTSAQKDALYYAEGWSASTIHEAPWH